MLTREQLDWMNDKLTAEPGTVEFLAVFNDVQGIEQPIREGLPGSPDALETILRHVHAGCYTIALDKAIEHIKSLILSVEQRLAIERLEGWADAWGRETLREIGQFLLDNLEVDEDKLGGESYGT